MRMSGVARRVCRPAIVLAAGALLFGASNASAAIYTATTTQEFVDDVAAANASIGVPDEIQLLSATTYSPTAGVVVTDDLSIRGNPTLQLPPGAPTIFNGAGIPPTDDPITVAEGVTLHVEAIQFQGQAVSQKPYINVQGNFVIENSTISSAQGAAIATDPVATAPHITVRNATLTSNIRLGLNLSSNGLLTMNNATVTNNSQGGMILDGTADIRNSVLAPNTAGNCFNANYPNPTDTVSINFSTDADGNNDGVPDCSTIDPTGGTGNNTGTANTSAAVGVSATFGANGGPVRTRAITATSTLLKDTADNAACEKLDARYFVRTDGACDRGAYELNAVRDTTPPSCGVTAVRRNGPAGHDEQDVGVQDMESGLQEIFGTNANGSFNITNGTVSVPTFTRGTNAQQTVTATKTDQTQKTRWSFNARDWAGNVTLCQ